MNKLLGTRPKEILDDSRRRDEIVQLIEPVSGPITSPVERVAVSNLQQEGGLPLHLFVQRVAAQLYFEELRNGAGVLDIGFFGTSLFVPDVVRTIRERNGTLWKIL